MKHNLLHSVAHNFTDSLVGGLSFVISHHVISISVFAEAASANDGYFVADFLTGRILETLHDNEMATIIPLYKGAFPGFCEKHHVDYSDYTAFLVRFISQTSGNKYVVTIEDRNGRRSSREYSGNTGKRAEVHDDLGRRRPKLLPTPLD